MDIDIHNELHHNLRVFEPTVSPSIEAVIAMHALAEFKMFDTYPPDRDPIRLLGQWAGICELGRDEYTAEFLKAQIPFIERGAR